MTANLEIRPASAGDAERISNLSQGVSSGFMLRPDGAGAEVFMASITPAATADRIAAQGFAYLTGWVGGEMAGVVAVREGTHLYHLFVAPAFHGRGIGGALLDAALERLFAGAAATVNSSIAAQPFYERFGFRATAARVEQDGLAFVPMRLGEIGDRPRFPAIRENGVCPRFLQPTESS